MISIWQPRWHDRTVLIATYKVYQGKNTVIFTKAKSLKGMKFTLDGSLIKSFPISNNGAISCYAVPLDVLLESKSVL